MLKTAEEWWDDSCPDNWGGREVVEWVKAIQLDALACARDCVTPDGNPESAIKKIDALIKSLKSNAENPNEPLP